MGMVSGLEEIHRMVEWIGWVLSKSVTCQFRFETGDILPA